MTTCLLMTIVLLLLNSYEAGLKGTVQVDRGVSDAGQETGEWVLRGS